MYQIFKYSFAKHTYKDYMQHHKMSIFTAKFLFNFTFAYSFSYFVQFLPEGQHPLGQWTP